MDGDTVLIQKCTVAENGAIVVALVDQNEVTLKRLRKRGDSIALEPANKAYETRIFGPDRVQGAGQARRADPPLLSVPLIKSTRRLRSRVLPELPLAARVGSLP